MAQLAQRWTVSPATLQRDKGRPFDLVTLLEHGHSHVYLVRLLTFDPTADGDVTPFAGPVLLRAGG